MSMAAATGAINVTNTGSKAGAGAAGNGAKGGSNTPPPAQTPPTPAKAGSGGDAVNAPSSGGHSGAAGEAHGGSGGAGSGGAPAGGSAAPASGSAADITGTLGALGPVQPVMNAWATTNGLETLIYLSSAPLTCEMMMTRGTKWLSSLPAKSQVIEIVVGSPSAAKTYAIGTSAALGGGEVNYAEGGKSSSTEVTGKAGTITLTKADAMGAQEGMIQVTAPYMASGKFQAKWCQGGTEF
jgi:hypothetical protein